MKKNQKISKAQKEKLLQEQKKAMLEQMRHKGPKNPLIWLFILALGIAMFYSYGKGDTITKVNDEIALSQIQAKYASGAYTKITLEGSKIKAEEAPVKAWDSARNQEITTKNVDETLSPPRDSLKDLGFFASGSTTEIVIKDEGWGAIWKEIVPTIISVVLMGLLIMFIISRVAGG